MKKALFAASLVVALLPFASSALSKEADAMCNPVKPECPCGQIMMGQPPKCTFVSPQANKFNCPPAPDICHDTTNGHMTIGTCPAPNLCKGTSSEGKGVDQGLSQLGQMLGQLMQQLMKGGGGGGGGSGSGSSPTTPTTPTCTTYYQTSDVSNISDPCAQYVPAVSGAISTSGGDLLSQALNNQAGQNLSDQINTNTNTNTNTNAGTSTNTSGNTSVSQNINTGTGVHSSQPVLYSSTTQGGLNALGLTNGSYGDFLYSQGAVTLFGGLRNSQTNTEVSGFFGSQTFGTGAQQGLASQLCRTRPWANNFLSGIIPVSFFDNLCTSRGYLVGQPPAPEPTPTQQQVTLTQRPATKAATTSVATTTNTITPKVSIWAVPASVPLGARTTIFWNTQGVGNCTETSPDGSFNQSSLSGGAATVPITNSTTFTISCVAPDGTPQTAYTTVRISI